jgi:hypothetical protein
VRKNNFKKIKSFLKKVLTFLLLRGIITKSSGHDNKINRGVAQMVARLVWDQDAAGSNPVTSTTMNSVFILNTEFFVFSSNHLNNQLKIKNSERIKS